MSAADAKADSIINAHMAYAMIGGAVPVPLLDLAAVSAIQLDMIRQLADAFGARFEPSAGKAMISSLLGGSAGRIGASAVKMLPGVGALLGGVAQVAVAGGATYALGRLFQKHFRKHKSIESLDPDEARSLFARYFEEGKRVARAMRGAPELDPDAAASSAASSADAASAAAAAAPTSSGAFAAAAAPTSSGAFAAASQADILDALERLSRLKDAGVLTEEELAAQKAKLLARL